MHRKDAQFRLTQIDAEIKYAKYKATHYQKKVSQLTKEKADIVEKLTVVSDKIEVPDHALIRYLERKHGFSFEKYKDEILTNTVKQAIKLGATSVKVGGIEMKVSNKKITTVV
jgi:hypothetical protein